MADFVIIPDSAADMIKELRKEFDIPDYVPGVVVTPAGVTEMADVDWERYTPKGFYDSMSDRKSLYKTACAPTGDIMAIYEKYLAQGKDVLAITLSSGLSVTYQTCQLVANELQEKYPQRKIIVVDSLRYSAGIALLTVLAAQKRDSGATLEETAAYLEEVRYQIHQMGSMDNLFFLVKTGRVSNFKAFFGTLVGVNAMADINRKGISEILGKAKGKKAAIETVIQYVKALAHKPEEQIMFIAHSDREEAANLLKERLQETFHPKRIITLNVGMSCGASIGPGLCAVFFVGAPVTEGMENEKKIVTEILNLKK